MRFGTRKAGVSYTKLEAPCPDMLTMFQHLKPITIGCRCVCVHKHKEKKIKFQVKAIQ